MLRAALLALCLFIPSTAFSVEKPIPSRVSAVTVFAAGAEVTRTATVALEPGVTTILLRDLPASTIENSVRVEGSGDKPLEVGSVDTRTIFVKEAGAEGALNETERRRIETEIQTLRDERAALDGAIEAASAEKTLALNLAELPKSYAKAAAPAPAAPDWPAVFSLIGGKVAEINKIILDAKIKQRSLDERIKVLEGRLNEQPPEETERTEVAIMVEAADALTANLVVRYQVPDAQWSPIYDARLDTGGQGREPALTLHRRAEISQETGEDWVDVDLTLSTSRPGGETQAPSLTPILVDFRPEPRPSPITGIPRSMAPLAEAPAAAVPSGAAADSAAKAIVRERVATVEASPFQAVFRVSGRSSVVSGVGARKLLIGSETVKPVLKIVTTPKESAAAFLHASFTHDSPAPFLPGKVALYRDGVFAGVASMDLVPAGQDYELGFGLDDGVKVSRVSVRRAKGETGIISASNVDEQHYKITLNNLHDREMPILVLDQMPYSEDENIAVEVLPITAQPFEVNYDDKRGVIAWSLDLKPKEERELAFSYQIKWPAKRDVILRPGG